MTDLTRMASLLRDSGPWTVAYVDGAGDEPQVIEEKKQDSVRRRLNEEGAPPADVEAVATALRDGAGLPSPSSRYIVVVDGAVVLDSALSGQRHGEEILTHGPVPPLRPLLLHGSADVGYLVVEAGREGAQLRWERAERSPEPPQEVEGRTDALPKVQAGGWSHAKHQRASEEIWKLNQREVAEAVDTVVRERQPAFVALAGDVRARQLLRDDLADASRALVLDVDAHTRADGADDSALEDAIARRLAELETEDLSTARSRARVDHGSHGVEGVEPVLRALQEAAVDTLVLDERMWDDERMLDALADVPWVDDGDALGVGSLGRVPAAEALARAALLTDADVLVEQDEYAAEDEAREQRLAREPLAVLRRPAA
ncbi:Vms1/Ankzf1 family peptidyl-tRNA hydrolase [Microbacterium sp. CIAB417]|uniref:baeRF2 domain-containing protein n=1 Tax=Microbacterium sp. CIAB417 TaxID=2860287 RepID=UPI001FACEA53|nr:Vms1/Ankzf1 family peptidyl-tRNA hydrolase [Microbacterium sp. CIAB417]